MTTHETQLRYRLRDRRPVDAPRRLGSFYRTAPSKKDLIDQARNGSFAAPVEIYVRIDELVGDRVSPRQLLQGEAQPAALLHEAYRTLTAPAHRTAAQRAYALAVGAAVLRRRLAHHATANASAPGAARSLPADTVDALLAPDASLSALSTDTLPAFDAALHQLGAQHARPAHIIECRLFGGMPVDLIALALERTPEQIRAGDSTARAWLRRYLTGSTA